MKTYSPAILLFTLLILIPVFSMAQDAMTQDELIRRTQELLDGVAAGDNAAWEKYFADDSLFYDEKGRTMDKATLVKEIAALPKGYVLKFKVENVQTRIFDDFAVIGFDIDEDLKVYGQQVGAKFHTTDTWARRNGNWQIIASQSMRYYGDPKQGDVDPVEFKAYVGTYELTPGVEATVTLDGANLYYQRGENPREQLLPEAPRIFFRKGVEGRMLFHFGKDGKVDAIYNRRNHEDLVWKKIR